MTTICGFDVNKYVEFLDHDFGYKQNRGPERPGGDQCGGALGHRFWPISAGSAHKPMITMPRRRRFAQPVLCHVYYSVAAIQWVSQGQIESKPQRPHPGAEQPNKADDNCVSEAVTEASHLAPALHLMRTSSQRSKARPHKKCITMNAN